MSFKQGPYQQEQMPKINLTQLKSMTEEDWQKVCNRLMFYDYAGAYRDYSDPFNPCVFKPRAFRTARESGMSMLRTLNFTNANIL